MDGWTRPNAGVGWGALSAELKRRVPGEWTSRSVRTLEGVLRSI
jgi:hypothetical protein